MGTPGVVEATEITGTRGAADVPGCGLGTGGVPRLVDRVGAGVCTGTPTAKCPFAQAKPSVEQVGGRDEPSSVPESQTAAKRLTDRPTAASPQASAGSARVLRCTESPPPNQDESVPRRDKFIDAAGVLHWARNREQRRTPLRRTNVALFLSICSIAGG